MNYKIVTQSEVKCNQTFADSHFAIEEAKRLSKELCCDCDVYKLESDGSHTLYAEISKRHIDSLGRFHDVDVTVYPGW